MSEFKYKEARCCEWCNYTTMNRSDMSKHKKRCKNRPIEADGVKYQLEQRVASLEVQLHSKDDHYQRELVAKDEHYKRELEAKDKQIEELLKIAKKPRQTHNTLNNTTNNTLNNTTNNHINIFGNESVEHISFEKLQELIKEPETAVALHVILKHSVEENRNVMNLHEHT